MEKLPPTEKILKKKENIDKMHLKDAIELMIDEHTLSGKEVKKNIKNIMIAVNEIVNRLQDSNTSRIFYAGAGTSARIGLQDGVELYPTFGWPTERVAFIIAGGKKSLTLAVENAEDNILDAEQEILKQTITEKDIVIGLAASGNTPFTCKVLELSKKKNALTIAISNNPQGKILNFGAIKIILNTQQEVVAGSTRLKAGTAQKICLNIISTMVMTKLGFVKNGRMNNLVPTNAKLRNRAKINNKKYDI